MIIRNKLSGFIDNDNNDTVEIEIGDRLVYTDAGPQNEGYPPRIVPCDVVGIDEDNDTVDVLLLEVYDGPEHRQGHVTAGHRLLRGVKITAEEPGTSAAIGKITLQLEESDEEADPE